MEQGESLASLNRLHVNILAVTDSEVTIAATGRATPLGPGDQVSITLNSDGSSNSTATF